MKKPGVPARAAFDENLTHYREQDRHLTPALSPIEAERGTLFWFKALLIASNVSVTPSACWVHKSDSGKSMTLMQRAGMASWPD